MSERWAGAGIASTDVVESPVTPSARAQTDFSGDFLSTRRLRFRCWSPGDESLAIDLWCNPQVTALIGGPWTRETALDRLALEIEQQRQHGMQYWPIFSLADGRFTGCAGLRPYDSSRSIFEMGVHLLPDFWGQGIAHEASEAIIHFAFGRLAAAAVCAGHHPQNQISGRLLKRLGFTYLRHQLYAPTGLMHPVYLLQKEQAQRTQARQPNS